MNSEQIYYNKLLEVIKTRVENEHLTNIYKR